MRSTAIIGASGWLGRQVVASARAAGHDVVAFGRRPAAGVDAVVDLTDPGAVAATLAAHHADVVVNAAGSASATGRALRQANVEVPRVLAEAARRLPIRLVHLGSAAEYGVGQPDAEGRLPETSPVDPCGEYGRTKAEGTGLVVDARAAGVDAVVLRIFNVVDADAHARSPLAEWAAQVREMPPTGGEVVVGNVAHERDLAPLDAVADAVVALSRARWPWPVVNVCTGHALRYGDIAAAMARGHGVDAAIRSLDRPGIHRVVGHPGRLEHILGRPLTPHTTPEAVARVALGLDSPADDGDLQCA